MKKLLATFTVVGAVIPAVAFAATTSIAESETQTDKPKTHKVKAQCHTKVCHKRVIVKKRAKVRSSCKSVTCKRRVSRKQYAAEVAGLGGTPSSNKKLARAIAGHRYGWRGGQFSCLVVLWHRESGWNHRAVNRSSGATGIPQALPGSKILTVGPIDSPQAQIVWGLNYIKGRYGSPCNALGHSNSHNWY